MLAKPASARAPQLFHAHSAVLRHLLDDRPLCGREKDDGKRCGVFERVEERSGGGVVGQEVFVDALTETENVGEAARAQGD